MVSIRIFADVSEGIYKQPLGEAQPVHDVRRPIIHLRFRQIIGLIDGSFTGGRRREH